MGIGGEVKRPLVAGHMWVPMDDENCMVYDWIYSFGGTPIDAKWRDEFEWGSGRGPEDRSADFRKTRNKTNNWMIDRKAQKTLGYSGIEGIKVRITAKAASPKFVAKQGHAIAVRSIFFGEEHSAHCRIHSQHRNKAWRNHRRRQTDGVSRSGQSD